MTDNSDARQRIVEALLSGEEQKLKSLSKRLGIEPKLQALCALIGVNPDGAEWARWALIGMSLAKAQPEFTGKPSSRGRPRKVVTTDIDVQRATFLDVEAHDYVSQKFGRRFTDKELISRLSGVAPLFPVTDDIQSLQNSVSRGRKKRELMQRQIDEALGSLKEK